MDYARNQVFDSHGKSGEKWVGFDIDATLAKYNGWKGLEHIGDPIPAMVLAIKQMHDAGKKVKIFTARVADKEDAAEARKVIESWCEKHLGFKPEITNVKDSLMEFCFDDRNVQIIPNEGVSVEEAFNDAIDIIKSLTNNFQECRGNLPTIERLVRFQTILNRENS